MNLHFCMEMVIIFRSKLALVGTDLPPGVRFLFFFVEIEGFLSRNGQAAKKTIA